MHRAMCEWLGRSANWGAPAGRVLLPKLDALRALRKQCGADSLASVRKHQAWKQLCQIPSIGPIRATVLLGILQTRTVSAPAAAMDVQRLGIETRSSADHRSVDGQLESSQETDLHSRLNKL